jgi:hypothetical protein
MLRRMRTTDEQKQSCDWNFWRSNQNFGILQRTRSIIKRVLNLVFLCVQKFTMDNFFFMKNNDRNDFVFFSFRFLVYLYYPPAIISVWGHFLSSRSSKFIPNFFMSLLLRPSISVTVLLSLFSSSFVWRHDANNWNTNQQFICAGLNRNHNTTVTLVPLHYSRWQ